MQPDVNRQFLVGCLAVRIGLLEFDQLADAWASGGAGVVSANGLLAPEDVAALEHLVKRGLNLTPAEQRLYDSGRPDGATRDLAPPTLTLTPDDPTATNDPHATASHDDGPSVAEVTTHTGRYTRTRLHATGGMGRVWVVRDPTLDRDVALKELRPDRADRSATRIRFVAEARITGRLEHPNIVPVYEFAPPGPGRAPFYTMRFVGGRTLAEAGKDYHRQRAAGTAQGVTFRELLAAFLGVCNAVAYAHGRGVIHRDLKGANVVLGEYGEVVVLDWGLAKELRAAEHAPDQQSEPDDDSLTQAGSIMGTPSYMAPEQAVGDVERIDTRSDVYGLGAVLYELLTGQPPFTSADTAEVLLKVRDEAPVAPRAVVSDVPRPLEAVCLKALAKRPEDRYATVTELAADVRRFLADEPVSARREPVLERIGRRLRKNRTLAAALAVAAGVLIPGLAVLAQVERQNVKSLGEEKKQTTAAKQLAEDRLGQVVDTWYTQLVTVQNELDQQAVSPRFRLGLLRTAEGQLADILRDQPRTRKTDHMRHVLHRRMADELWRAGDLTRAESEIAEARRIADERFREDPDGPDSRRDVSQALDTLADIRTEQGRWDDALAALAEAATHNVAHLKAHPRDARTVADRANDADRRARILTRAGRDATAAHTDAVRLAREVADAQPDDARAQFQLLRALRTSASAALSLQQPVGDSLIEAHDRVTKMIARDAGNPSLRAELADVLSLQADDALARGDGKTARTLYTQILPLRDEFARRADAPAEAMRDLAVAYERLGDMSRAEKKNDAAEVEYSHAARHLDRAFAVEPSRPVRVSLGNVHARLADLYTEAGNVEAARASLARCREHREKLLEETPADSEVVHSLAEHRRLAADLERSPTALRFDVAAALAAEGAEFLHKVRREAWPERDRKRADAVVGYLTATAAYCRQVHGVILDPTKATELPPGQAFPLFIARMRVQARDGDAAGAAATGDLVAKLSPRDSAYLAGAARGYALAVRASPDATAKERYAVVAESLLTRVAEIEGKPRVLVGDADFAAFLAYRGRPIPPAAP